MQFQDLQINHFYIKTQCHYTIDYKLMSIYELILICENKTLFKLILTILKTNLFIPS